MAGHQEAVFRVQSLAVGDIVGRNASKVIPTLHAPSGAHFRWVDEGNGNTLFFISGSEDQVRVGSQVFQERYQRAIYLYLWRSTRVCPSIINNEECAYGVRCQFIH